MASSNHLVLAIAAAVAIAGCGGSADDAPNAAAPVAETTTTAPTSSTTVPPTTSTTTVYESLGEEVTVVETALGAVTWRFVTGMPSELRTKGVLPGPGYADGWIPMKHYEHAEDVTGTCFEIFRESAGYLGLGPCRGDWLPFSVRFWGPWDQVHWNWMSDVWFSPDGDTWEAMAPFPDVTAAVVAEPGSVDEHDGRWVVIGATGVSPDADIPLEDRTTKEWGTPGLIVPKSAEPAAWVSDDLVTWERLALDFTEPDTRTRLTSVAAGKPGWVIFGVRTLLDDRFNKEWVGWASADGLEWEELALAGVFDDPCDAIDAPGCGAYVKADLLDDAIVAYAWTWGPGCFQCPLPGWRLLLGAF